jgi:hypothetical protein
MSIPTSWFSKKSVSGEFTYNSDINTIYLDTIPDMIVSAHKKIKVEFTDLSFSKANSGTYTVIAYGNTELDMCKATKTF